jgi:5'-nucleotidase
VQGQRNQELMRLDERLDGRGNPYYWITFARGKLTPEEGTDLHALADRKISITPIKLDLTDLPTATEFARVFGG